MDESATPQMTAIGQLASARKLDVGAEFVEDMVEFRVWAPGRRKVEVVFESQNGATAPDFALKREEQGYFSGRAPKARAGMCYRFRLDGRAELLPDPASRFQPRGPHGPSEIIDSNAFAWTDANWQG